MLDRSSSIEQTDEKKSERTTYFVVGHVVSCNSLKSIFNAYHHWWYYIIFNIEMIQFWRSIERVITI